jgi:hypothetical protein
MMSLPIICQILHKCLILCHQGILLKVVVVAAAKVINAVEEVNINLDTTNDVEALNVNPVTTNDVEELDVNPGTTNVG